MEDYLNKQALKSELMNYVGIYANNVDQAIMRSSADAATKRLAKEIAEQTSAMFAALVKSISK